MFLRVSDDPEADERDRYPRPLLIRIIRFPNPRLNPKDDSLRTRTATRILELGADTLILGLMLGSISLIELIAKAILDLERNDLLRWMIHGAYVLAFLKYVYNVILDLRK